MASASVHPESLARSPAKVAGVPQVVGDKAAAPPVVADGAAVPLMATVKAAAHPGCRGWCISWRIHP